MNKASRWLQEQRRAKNLSLRDLARETGLTHATIGNAEHGTEVSFETWAKIAEYFKEPINNVLTWAGYLKPVPSKDELIERIESDLRAMSPEAREQAARIIRALAGEN